MNSVEKKFLELPNGNENGICRIDNESQGFIITGKFYPLVDCHSAQAKNYVHSDSSLLWQYNNFYKNYTQYPKNSPRSYVDFLIRYDNAIKLGEDDYHCAIIARINLDYEMVHNLREIGFKIIEI